MRTSFILHLYYCKIIIYWCNIILSLYSVNTPNRQQTLVNIFPNLIQKNLSFFSNMEKKGRKMSQTRNLKRTSLMNMLSIIYYYWFTVLLCIICILLKNTHINMVLTWLYVNIYYHRNHECPSNYEYKLSYDLNENWSMLEITVRRVWT